MTDVVDGAKGDGTRTCDGICVVEGVDRVEK